MAVRIPDLTSMILQKIVETLFCFLGVVFLISEIIYFIVKPPISRSPFSIFSQTHYGFGGVRANKAKPSFELCLFFSKPQNGGSG